MKFESILLLLFANENLIIPLSFELKKSKNIETKGILSSSIHLWQLRYFYKWIGIPAINKSSH